jgi:NADH-quinone oxidoreductase subunit H
VLIPGALVWILLIATIRVWRRQGGSPGVYIVAGLIIAGLLAAAWAWDAAEARRARQAEEIEAAEAEAEAAAGAFPVPALDLPHYHGIGVFAGDIPAASAETAGSAGNEVTGA